MTKLFGIAVLVVIAILFCGPASGQGQEPAAQAMTATPDAWANVYGQPVRPVYRVPMYYQGTVAVPAPVVSHPVPPTPVVIGWRYRPGYFPCLFGRRWVARPVYGVR